MAQTTRATVPQLRRADQIELSAKQELTYGDVMPTLDINLNYPFLGDVVPVNQKVIYEGREGEIGNGYEWADNQDEINRELKMSLSHRMSGETAALMAAFGLGKVTTVAGTDVGAYIHTISPMLRTTAAPAAGTGGASQLPSMSMRLKDGPNQYIADGLCLDSFEIDAQIGKVATIKSDWLGSGRLTTDANAFQTLAVPNHLRLSKVQIGVAASEEDVTKAVKGISFKWNNKIDSNFIGAIYKSAMLAGERAYEFSLDLFQHSTDTDLVNYLANTALQAILTFEGATIVSVDKYKLVVTLFQVRTNDREIAKSEALKLGKLKFHPEAYSANGDYLEMVVTNMTAAYLAMST